MNEYEKLIILMKNEVKNNNLSIATYFKYLKHFKKYKLKHLIPRYKRLRKLKSSGVTKYRLFLLYGKNEGLKRWNSYCEKQAYTNTKEYKIKIKGMSEEEVNLYNKSRAVTKENFIKRYGSEEGLAKWNSYCERQAYTKSKQRYIDEYGINGEKIFENINKLKKHNLENYIRKYGKEKGSKKYKEYVSNVKITNYSKKASNFFKKLDLKLNNKLYFSPKTREMTLYCKEIKKNFFYDCYFKEKNLIIEFNGDVFHGNPKLFLENDCPNPYDKTQTSKDIWEYDKIKLRTALSKNYKIIIIWEKYYDTNKEQLINQILNYINSNNYLSIKEFNI